MKLCISFAFIRLMLLSSTVFWKDSFIFIAQQFVIYISFYFFRVCTSIFLFKYESHLSTVSFKSISSGFRLDLIFFLYLFHCGERVTEEKNTKSNGITFKAVGILFSHQNGIYPRNMIMCISNPLQFNCVLLDWRLSTEYEVKII